MSEPALDELRGLLEVERTRITAAIAYLQEDSQRTMDENGLAGLEEERRLAYVGLTRARRQAKVYYAADNDSVHADPQLAFDEWIYDI